MNWALDLNFLFSQNLQRNSASCLSLIRTLAPPPATPPPVPSLITASLYTPCLFVIDLVFSWKIKCYKHFKRWTIDIKATCKIGLQLHGTTRHWHRTVDTNVQATAHTNMRLYTVYTRTVSVLTVYKCDIASYFSYIPDNLLRARLLGRGLKTIMWVEALQTI